MSSLLAATSSASAVSGDTTASAVDKEQRIKLLTNKDDDERINLNNIGSSVSSVAASSSSSSTSHHHHRHHNLLASQPLSQTNRDIDNNNNNNNNNGSNKCLTTLSPTAKSTTSYCNSSSEREAAAAANISNSSNNNNNNNNNNVVDNVDIDKPPVKSSVPQRDTWAGKLDFILSCVGYCIGLGNVWRFPYLCYENGGGAFLLPYLLMLVLAGTPMYVLEASLGQLTSSGVLGCWKMCPIFKGVGYGATVMAFWLNLYYIVILSWAAFYLAHSFQYPLPWASCKNWWNTAACYEDSEIIDCLKRQSQNSAAAAALAASTASSPSLLLQSPANASAAAAAASAAAAALTNNASSCAAIVTANGTAAVREFWINYTLQKSSGIDQPGEVRWQLCICLFAMWTLCYFCIWKGVKWTGKVVYFTALFPYVLLIVLFFRAITLPGAAKGVVYYVYPRFEAMLNSQVWIKAATQIFFSHGLGVGAVIALGSYNPFHNNVYRDAMFLSAVDCCTAVFAGLVVFATVGFMAEVRGEDVSKVAASGPGLAFLAYPAAVSQLPWAPLWAVLFFIMIILLGIDSQFCTVEGFMTAWVDEFPNQLRKRKEIFLAVVCVISFFIGISLITQGGIYVFDLLDHFSQTMTLLFIIFFECVAISWSYGVDNFVNDITLMIGYKPFVFWKYAWLIFTPSICVVIGICWSLSFLAICGSAVAAVAVYGFAVYEPLKYETGPGQTYHYPSWALAVGWLITASSIAPPVIYAIIMFINTPGDMATRTRLLFRPGYMNPNKEAALKNRNIKLTGNCASNNTAI